MHIKSHFSSSTPLCIGAAVLQQTTGKCILLFSPPPALTIYNVFIMPGVL